MRLKSLSLILNPTAINTWYAQPTKHPFSINSTFQLTSPCHNFIQLVILQLYFSGLLQLSSTALFTRPSITSTSFLHTRPPANGSLLWIKGWFTDGFSVMKTVLPVAFHALANVAHYNLLLLLHWEKQTSPRINPKSLIYPNARCKKWNKRERKSLDNDWLYDRLRNKRRQIT